ncbi:Protein zwilch like protein [Eufriesea mexicana]|uniref:Protein zwilch n=2 Tax=Eufriesea mexicana TaxID=516756 RepID=A0A310SSZ4_9HYME|nr:Protein zwilch like protein [Eufriesea mexicana]
MSEFKLLRKILDSSIKIDKICLSYVTRIFPEFKDASYIILYKEAFESIVDHSKSIDNDETNQFEVIGSPLKYSFDEEDDFEDSMILIKQNWHKEEEKYMPLNRIEACHALNICVEFMNVPFLPILALCDGKDNKKSRLLGIMIDDEWFTTIEVYSSGTETLETLNESSSEMFQQHLELSHVCEQDVTVSAFSTFDLFGTMEEMINWDNNLKSNFEGSLRVEVDSCSLLLCPHTRASKYNLIAQIVTNTNHSSMIELWKQLLLINQYLNIIEDYRKNVNTHYNSVPLQFPHDFINPYKKEHSIILNNLSLLLNGDYSSNNYSDIEEEKINFLNEENLGNDIKIHKYVQSLPFRHNLDFTDFLWELLIQNSNYFEMTKCIHIVLEEIIINNCLPQINHTNSTKFAKIITNPHQQKIISPLLSGSLPLEYVIDMGFKKLCKDYICILANTGFGELHDIQQKLKNLSCNEFIVNTYRETLIYLVQIHICLEFIVLIQNNLGCSSEDLRTLFCCALKQYVGEMSPVKNDHDLHQNKIYTLTLPLPVSAISNLNTE